MIGAEIIMFRSPSSPTSTGHVFRFSHPCAASLSSSGGSISETNSPPSTSSAVWVETKVRLSVLSRSSPLHGVVLIILTVTLKRSEEHTSELQSRQYLVCRLLLEKKKTTNT